MDVALVAAILLVTSVRGQLDSDIVQPDYEYENGHFFQDDEASLNKDYITSPREQKFMDALIVEAGRHVLMPELYLTKEEREKGKLKVIDLGQPEIEESYLNQKSRRGGSNCPNQCTLYKPVCGTDGKVYESECHMRKENCGDSSVTTGHWQKCRGKHYLCPTRCLDLNDPVCGSDGRIYHNVCILRKRNCGKLIDVQPLRKCYENYRQSEGKNKCPDDCLEIYKPACGSDGVIYYNECFLRKRTCNLGIVEVAMDSCVHVPKCPEVCLPLYDPVCGSDRRLYINHCRMLQENCGNEVKVLPKSACAGPSTRTVTVLGQGK